MRDIVFTDANPAAALPSQQRWTRLLFQLEPHASLSDTRMKFWSLLEEEDFVPPCTWHQAAWVLENEALGVGDSESMSYYQQHRNTTLAGEIRQFAAEFFQLTLAERQSRWKDLYLKAESDSAAALWLKQLEPGLRIIVPNMESESETLQTILRNLLEVFTLPPNLAGPRKRELLQQSNFKEWSLKKAAERLRWNYSQYLALLPDFLPTVEAHLEYETKFTGSEQAAARADGSEAIATLPSLQSDELSAAKSASKKSGDWEIHPVLAIFIVIKILVLCIKFGGPPSPNSSNYPVTKFPPALRNSTQTKPPQTVTFPLNREGKVEIQSQGDPNNKAAEEALQQILGLPPDVIELVPAKTPNNSDAASGDALPPQPEQVDPENTDSGE